MRVDRGRVLAVGAAVVVLFAVLAVLLDRSGDNPTTGSGDGGTSAAAPEPDTGGSSTTATAALPDAAPGGTTSPAPSGDAAPPAPVDPGAVGAACLGWLARQQATLAATDGPARADALREVVEVSQQEVEVWSGPEGGPDPAIEAAVVEVVDAWERALQAYDAGDSASGDRETAAATTAYERVVQRDDLSVAC